MSTPSITARIKANLESPITFENDEIISLLTGGGEGTEGGHGNSLTARAGSLPFTCGLVLKLRTASIRVCKQNRMKYPEGGDCTGDSGIDCFAIRLYKLVQFYCSIEEFDSSFWTPNLLFVVSKNISRKNATLSNKLQLLFQRQPLILNIASSICESEDNKSLLSPANLSSLSVEKLEDTDLINAPKLVFTEEFQMKIQKYFDELARPEGTFDLEPQDYLVETLASLERDDCPKCNKKRHVYCGDCGGMRLSNSESILPPRVKLPFDILIFLHWHETLHKCTGVHAAVLGSEGDVSYAFWQRAKCGSDWEQVIESLDPQRDVILFPSKDAISANKFPWKQKLPHQFDNETDSNETVSTDPASIPLHRWRLVVLEASWQNGKTMARAIASFREEKNLPPLHYVVLEDIVGSYWKFQSEGNAAVSTIEAIAHAASAAGLDAQGVNNLLVLFRLQKYRVLKRVTEDKTPTRAMNPFQGLW